jgi:hypothetical protein
VWNYTDSVELKYWGINLLKCNILSTTYPRWKVLELHLILLVRWSANNRLSHERASLDLKFYWYLWGVRPYRALNTVLLGYNNESVIAVYGDIFLLYWETCETHKYAVMQYLYFADIQNVRYIKFPRGVQGLITVGMMENLRKLQPGTGAGHIVLVLR